MNYCFQKIYLHDCLYVPISFSQKVNQVFEKFFETAFMRPLNQGVVLSLLIYKFRRVKLRLVFVNTVSLKQGPSSCSQLFISLIFLL